MSPPIQQIAAFPGLQPGHRMGHKAGEKHASGLEYVLTVVLGVGAPRRNVQLHFVYYHIMLQCKQKKAATTFHYGSASTVFNRSKHMVFKAPWLTDIFLVYR